MPEIRCPKHPGRLLGKVRGHVRVEEGANLIEIACRDCRNDLRAEGHEVSLVVHLFNVGGEHVGAESTPALPPATLDRIVRRAKPAGQRHYGG